MGSRVAETLGVVVAFSAGLFSFLSPCVLPLVPPYLCFLAGTTFEHLIAREPGPLVARRERGRPGHGRVDPPRSRVAS